MRKVFYFERAGAGVGDLREGLQVRDERCLYKRVLLQGQRVGGQNVKFYNYLKILFIGQIFEFVFKFKSILKFIEC